MRDLLEEVGAPGMISPATVYTEKTGILWKGRAYLYEIVFTAEGANDYVDIYDGVSSAGRHLVRMSALNHTTFQWSPKPYATFHTGLYVEINGSNGHLTVQILGASNFGGRT